MGSNDELVGSWAEMPSCPSCFSTEASTFFRGCVGTNQPHVWHRENGHPTPHHVDGGYQGYAAREVTLAETVYAVTNPEPPGYMERVYAANMRLTPYRTCCESLVDASHLSGCMWRFFVDGQQVVKPNIGALAYPWDRAPMMVCEDTGSSDRTFENESRINQRQPLQPHEWWF